ncbi:MAG: energy-coupling factor transporter transmembrane component T family protein [Rhodoglobus sp.]
MIIDTTTQTAAARLNPVATMLAAALISAPLLWTIDPVSALVALALEMPLFFWAGLSFVDFFRRTAVLWFSAPLAAMTTVLYGLDSGAVLWRFGFVSVTEGSLELGWIIMLRMLATGLPAVVLFVTTDPTDLADGLGQVLRLPERFVIGGLAALRLIGLLIDDWRSLSLARRARGVGDTALLRRAAGQAFAVLVLAIRRGTKLATAMEARGFAVETRRTWARPSSFGWPEIAVIALGVVIAISAITVSVATGHWRWVFA